MTDAAAGASPPQARPIRVLLVIRSLGHGGAERQLVTLARALAARGHAITVATFYGGGALEQELDGAGVALHSLGKTGRWDVLGFVRRLAAFARAVDPDIIHGYMPTSNLLATAARQAAPRARLVWGVRASGVDWRRYDRLARLEFQSTRLLSRRADLVIANSHEGAAWHRAQGYPDDRLVVIPNGIDVERFRPDAGARARRRAAWGVGDDELLIGLVGRLDPMKDHPTFLRAAALAAGGLPRARFVCVGAGPEAYAAKLRALSESLGLTERLRWEPPSADVEASYAALDVLTCASAFGEGFPNVVGEAMACGVPCVVTACGDAPQVVGDTGRVVPIGDAPAMAAAFTALNAADRSALGARARARVVDEFSVARLAGRTEAALRRLLPERRGP